MVKCYLKLSNPHLPPPPPPPPSTLPSSSFSSSFFFFFFFFVSSFYPPPPPPSSSSSSSSSSSTSTVLQSSAHLRLLNGLLPVSPSVWPLFPMCNVTFIYILTSVCTQFHHHCFEYCMWNGAKELTVQKSRFATWNVTWHCIMVQGRLLKLPIEKGDSRGLWQ